MVAKTRRDFLRETGLGLAGAAALLASRRASSETGRGGNPNIVLLFADDLGYGSVSCNGGDLPTPNIDALAAGGVRFTDGYMTAPVCNPSRAGLLTGRYQQRWGKELNSQTEAPIGAPRRGTLPRSQKTIGAALKAQGYSTGAIGKWHMGVSEGHHPLDRGFDYFFGMASGTDYVDLDWPGVHHTLDRVGGMGKGGLMRGREPAPLEEYLTDQLTREGIEFIKRHKAEPFFLYLAHYAPHTPLQVTDKYYQRFPQFKNETKRIYAGMISALDDGVGAVMDTLEQEGLLENTLVFFASDNGAAKSIDVDGRPNYPFTGHKRNLYEGGIRIPFAVQWRGVLPEGKIYEKPVSSLDIFPTALAAAGVEDFEGHDLDGTNLLPYLKGKDNGEPHEYLFWRSGPNAVVRKGKWKLLMAGESLSRLYNLDKDQGETKDRSAESPELVKEMKKAFAKWNEQMAEPRKSSRTVDTHFGGDTITWHI